MGGEGERSSEEGEGKERWGEEVEKQGEESGWEVVTSHTPLIEIVARSTYGTIICDNYLNRHHHGMQQYMDTMCLYHLLVLIVSSPPLSSGKPGRNNSQSLHR